MSLKVMTWVFYESKAKGIDKLVLLAIADHAHDDGASAYPGLELLAKKAGVSEATVSRSIHRLQALGELEIEKGERVGRGAKFAYTVLMGKVAERNLPSGKGCTAQPEKVAETPSPIKEEPSQVKNRTTAPLARSDVDQLCSLLAERIISNGGTPTVYQTKATSKAWRNPMRLLLDRDLERDRHGDVVPAAQRVERVERAINWCQDDGWWRSVILSPANLRENYDRLRLAAQRPQATGNGRGPSTAQQKSEREWKLELGRVKEERRKAELEALRSRRPA